MLVVVALSFVLCFQCTRDTVSNTITLQGVYQSEQPTLQLQLTPTNESVHAGMLIDQVTVLFHSTTSILFLQLIK